MSFSCSAGIRARCPICTSTFHSNNIGALPCGHTFHYDCAIQWIKNAKSCPICRAKVPHERNLIKQLFFDADDVSPSQQEEVDHLAKVEELSIELQKERDEHLKTKEKQLEERKSKESIQDLLEREKKKVKRIPALEEAIRILEMRNDEFRDVQEKLKRTTLRLKACEFYKIVAEKGDSEDPSRIDKYIDEKCDVDGAHFVKLFRRKQEAMEKKAIEYGHERTGYEREIRALKEKAANLQEIVNAMTDELREVMAAANMRSPYNPKLKPLLCKTPPKRISMGFNESLVDLNVETFQSALRHPPRKIPKRKAEMDDVFTTGRISLKPAIPSFPDLDDTLDDSELTVPQHILERVKAGPSKPTSATGAIPTMKMKAMENLKKQHEERVLAPKPVTIPMVVTMRALEPLSKQQVVLAPKPVKNSVKVDAKGTNLKTKKSKNPAENRKPTTRISAFFSRAAKCDDIIDLDSD